MTPDHHPEPEYVIQDLDTLKVVSDPRRMAILEELGRHKTPQTVKQVAQALREDPGKLYYHVGLLERHGLIVVADTRLVSGIVEKHYGLRARAYTVGEGLLQAVEHDDLSLFAQFVANSQAEIEASVRVGLLDMDALGRTALIQKAQGLRLRPDKLRELCQRLDALLLEYDDPANQDPDPDAQAYSLLVALYPTVRSDQAADEPRLDSAFQDHHDPQDEEGKTQ